MTIKTAELVAMHDVVLEVTYLPPDESAISADTTEDSTFPMLLNYDYQD